MDTPPPISPPAGEALPNWLRAVLAHPPVARKPWTWSLAPAFIGLFLWVVYFDQLPRETLAHGTLAWATFGCGVGALLAFLMFYLPLALWGITTRRPLGVVATRTFGVRGAAWVPQALVTLVQVVWLAVSVRYATLLCLTGLKLIHLVDPDWIRPVNAWRMTWPSPVFAVTALVWTYFIALAGRYLMRVIAALMNVYPVVVAMILGITMVLALHLASLQRRLPARPVVNQHVTVESVATPAAAAVVAVQMILGFFATAGLFSVDWGAVTRDRAEVRKGGFVCVGFASWIIATLALQTVVWTRFRTEPATTGLLPSSTFCAAIPALYGEWLGGAILIALSLATLAPGCYAAFLIGMRLHELLPRRTRTRWTLTGAITAWLLIMLSERVTLLGVFGVVGALLAPVAGAMAADFLRASGRWEGARAGTNPVGLLAWASGVIVGLVPMVIDGLYRTDLRYREPAVLFAYIVAFVVYYVLATLRLETATLPDLISPAAD